MKELASRINAHLKRFEADKKINAINPIYKTSSYYYAWATYTSGSRIQITYLAYQGPSHITREEANIYLKWLDAGNVGRHWEALRKERERARKP